MAILKPTKIVGRVEAILASPDRAPTLEKQRVPEVAVTYGGFAGDCHGGETRASCVRVRAQYAEGTEIRNTRQVSIVSTEELELIAGDMEIAHLAPEWLGANLLISGIADFTLVPPSSRLIFDGGASLVVDMENGPCKYPAQVIEQHYPGQGMQFPKHARNRRGVTAWVEREGMIRQGDAIALHIPPQRIYAHG